MCFWKNTKEATSGLASCPWMLPHSRGWRLLGPADFSMLRCLGNVLRSPLRSLALCLWVLNILGFFLPAVSPVSALQPLSTCPDGTISFESLYSSPMCWGSLLRVLSLSLPCPPFCLVTQNTCRLSASGVSLHALACSPIDGIFIL